MRLFKLVFVVTAILSAKSIDAAIKPENWSIKIDDLQAMINECKEQYTNFVQKQGEFARRFKDSNPPLAQLYSNDIMRIRAEVLNKDGALRLLREFDFNGASDDKAAWIIRDLERRTETVRGIKAFMFNPRSEGKLFSEFLKERKREFERDWRHTRSQSD